jgi:hypothetical protein
MMHNFARRGLQSRVVSCQEVHGWVDGRPVVAKKACGAIRLPRVSVVEASDSGKCDDFARARRFGSAHDRRIA